MNDFFTEKQLKTSAKDFIHKLSLECGLDCPSDEQIDFFFKRTKEHVERVQSNMYSLLSHFPYLSCADYILNARRHDSSKYNPKLIVQYIYLTWYHKCKNEGIDYKYPDKYTENMIKKATECHVKNSKHHPQFNSNIKNGESIYIAEYVADCCAMSLELGTDLKDWFKTQEFPKYNFGFRIEHEILKYCNVLDWRGKMQITPQEYRMILSNRRIIANADYDKKFEFEGGLINYNGFTHIIVAKEVEKYDVYSIVSMEMLSGIQSNVGIHKIKRRIGHNMKDEIIGWAKERDLEMAKQLFTKYNSKTQVTAATKWKKGDRIIIQLAPDEYYLGTVSMLRGTTVYVHFDDGDKDSYSVRSKKIVGIGVKRKLKRDFTKKDLKKYAVEVFENKKKVPKVKKPKVKKPTEYDLSKEIRDHLSEKTRTVTKSSLYAILKDRYSKTLFNKVWKSLIEEEYLIKVGRGRYTWMSNKELYRSQPKPISRNNL